MEASDVAASPTTASPDNQAEIPLSDELGDLDRDQALGRAFSLLDDLVLESRKLDEGANRQMAFPLSVELTGTGSWQTPARIASRRKRTRLTKAQIEEQRLEQQLAQADLFMQRFKALFPNVGPNTYDWSGLARDMHLALLRESLADIRDPTCTFGSEKHADVWTWVHGIDRAAQIPFSFEACCRYADEDPDELRAVLAPYFVRQPGISAPRRLNLRALAQARGLTWDQWRTSQRVYRALADAVDAARRV